MSKITFTEKDARKYLKSDKFIEDSKRIEKIKDRDINYSDIPEDIWKNIKITTKENKDKISLRLDKDILAWFKKSGGRYQTKINMVLRSYINHQISKEKKTIRNIQKNKIKLAKHK